MTKYIIILLSVLIILAGCSKSENKLQPNTPSSTSVKSQELVTVKYQGLVDVSRMQCETITRSSLINRLCYDAAEKYAVVILDNTYYHYCAVPQNIIGELNYERQFSKRFELSA